MSLKGQEVVEFSLTDAQVTTTTSNIVVTVQGVETTVDASSMDATDGSTSHGVLGPCYSIKR